MVRRVLGFATVMAFVFTAMGCGGGFSDEKSAERCDQERVSKSQCVTDAAYSACLACYKQCGDKCVAQASCPETYECEGDDGDGSGSGAGTGGAAGE